MTDGCGPRWSEPFAWFDPDTSSWRTCHPSLLTTLGESSSVTWPRSGTWGAGFAYEHPTSAPVIDGSACSSLLPTPTAQEPGGTVEAHLERKNRLDGAHRTKPTHLALWIQLLLTPTVGDSKAACNATAGRSDPDSKHHDGTTLTDAVRLLPTPTARDHKDGVPCEAVEENGLLGRVVWRMLPTPTAGDGTAGVGLAGEPGERGMNLRTTVASIGAPTPPPSPGTPPSSADLRLPLWTSEDD